MRMRPYLKSGFTIVELLIVIVVIGILAAITIVAYNGVQQKAVTASLASDLDNSFKQLKLFQVDNNAYPSTINCAVADSPTNKCLRPSIGTTYQYISSATPQLFCLSATNGNYSYNINPDSSPLAGPCPLLRLDASNSTSYPGSGLNWADLSGNGNNGILQNGVGYNLANGGSLSFNGINNYVDAGQNPAFDITGPMTVSAWVKTTQTTFGGIVTKYNTPTAGVAYGYDFAVYTNRAVFTIRSGANGWNLPANSPTAINDNNWHYVVGVYDGSNVTSYDNAVAGPSVPWAFGSSPSPSTLQVGSRGGSGNFAGQIGAVQIYSRALSSIEISQNFNAQRGRYGL